uniref:ATP-dependent Clp protease proteolytic subunit n=1 Tax=Vicia ramuliflora TaxID=1144939 RepID=A0A7D4WWK5_9FABA|nr:clp protease proteolytic subunit [Vicia ramuliflora]
MPLGIPKINFNFPGDDENDWLELYEDLYDERLVFLGQKIDNETSNQVVGTLVYLSLEENDKDLYLFINSPGGYVISGMSIYDTMQIVAPDVQTVCMGIAASMASVILAGGEITKRTAFPNSRVMIHQPATSFFDGQAVDVVLEANELLVLRTTITTLYSERTGKPFWQISEDMERDFFMSAEEAEAYGLVDAVGDF